MPLCWWGLNGVAYCGAPVWILGGASDSFGPAYTVAPVWDFQPRADAPPVGLVGARAACMTFVMAGLDAR